MSIDIIKGVVELGLIFSILSFGIYVTFKILDFPDLSVDGSFTLGSVVCAILTLNNHPFLGIGMGFLCGAIAGLISALLHTKLRIQYILSGILTMTALYSINLMIASNKPNISLFENKTIFSIFNEIFENEYSNIVVLILIVTFISAYLIFLFKTHLGRSLKATGDNEIMAQSFGINTNMIKIFALSLANGLVGLAAALYTQHQGFYDISIGIGMMLIGLTGIIIGESIIKKDSVSMNLLATIFGAILYRLILAITLSLGMNPNSWKLICAILVIALLSLDTIKGLLNRKEQSYVRD